MNEFDELMAEIKALIAGSDWEAVVSYPLGPDSVDKTIQVRKVAPPALGIHIQDGVGAADKLGG